SPVSPDHTRRPQPVKLILCLSINDSNDKRSAEISILFVCSGNQPNEELKMKANSVLCETEAFLTCWPAGPTKRFPVSDATAILREALSSFLKEERYEVQRARELSLTLSAVIRERVKALRTPRYKLVVLVTVGQLNGQGLEIGSRCLWDVTHDTFASYSFKNSSLFGVASVFAVYFE
uniref:Dynein light chain Tctex-type family member 5 n=1 Tax=Kryptolebias marmoratus TaxID=37003 RepID=A0A3Q2ZT38_KRYMA